ncbi:hypothetical protein [Cellulomonas hominis]|uniref:hypothetical protein n=1 Tax=Cellulomonas hominis TaxID=156981 RepID=UPI001443A6FA|nr:hypothetical protein [Cellulomonas hominis]NKY08959.1 hypothetical protein [Cellulomonas hominis]
MPDRIIRRLNGPRGSVLVACALADVAVAISCLPPGTTSVAVPQGVAALAQVVPLWIWAVLWLVAALCSAIGAARRRDGSVRRGWDTAGYAATAGMCGGWFVLYCTGWVTDPDPSRQWLLAALFLGLTGVVINAARMRNPIA